MKPRQMLLTLIGMALLGLAAAACVPAERVPPPQPTAAGALPTQAPATLAPTLAPTAEAPTAAPTAAPSPAPASTTAVTGEKTTQLIAYVAGRNIWISAGQDAGRQLTTSGADDAPRLSPDGRWVLFQRELTPGSQGFRRYELRLVAASGGADRLVAGPENLPGEGEQVRLPYNPGWSPDSTTVYFNTTLECGMCAVDTDLWTVDLSGTAPRRLLENGQGGGFAPSPDGKRLLISSDTSIALVDAAGQNRQELLTFPRFSFPEGSFVPSPAWSVDGTYALAAIPEGQAGGEAVLGMWKLPAGGQASQMTKAPAPGMAFGVPGGAWSPDRAYFGYTAQNGHVLLASLGKMPPTDAGPGLFLGWAPDSRGYTYLAGAQAKGLWGQGLTLGRVGGEPQALLPTETAVALQPVRWLDAKTFIYFAKLGNSFDGDGFELRIQPVGGSPVTLFKSDDPFASRGLDVSH